MSGFRSSTLLHDCQDLLTDAVAATLDQAVASHTAYQGNIRFFTVPVDRNSNFWTGYCQLLAEEKQELYLGEVIKEAAPVFAHLIFRFPLSNEDDDLGEGISYKFIQGLVAKYQEAVNHVIDLDSDETDQAYITVVTESEDGWDEESYGERYWCMELKLQFPYCKVETRHLSRIRDQAVKLLATSTLVSSTLGRGFAGDWKSVIQPVGKTLPLYGSVEVKGRPRMATPKIYPRLEYEEAIAGELETMELEAAFNPLVHSDFQRNSALIKSVLFENLDEENKLPEEDLINAFPFFLSVNYSQAIQNARIFDSQEEQRYRHVPNNALKSLIGATETPNALLTSESTQDMAEALLRMLKPYRYDLETYWTDIGAALHHSFHGDENGLRMWIRYSRRNLGDRLPDFIARFGTLEQACTREYPTFEGSGITVKTLGSYAQNDNLRDYNTWHKAWVEETYVKALEGGDNDIAHCVYRSYWLDFRYAPSSARSGAWYYFKDNRWLKIDEGMKLRKLLSGDFKYKLEIMRTEMSKLAEGPGDKKGKASLEFSIKQANKVISMLGNNTNKNRIMAECREFFSDAEFTERLDSKPYLTGCRNGVIEVRGSTCFFRKGKPEDYISLSTRVNYEKDYNWDHPLVKECREWIRRVFHSQELINFFMKFAASGLVAGNIDKVFMLWTGVGNNSKSMIVKLFECSFGEYTKSLPYSVFSEKGGNPGAANPQIARLAGARFATTMEPSTETGFTLNAGHIKRLTGNDKQYARKLNENGGEITMTYKVIFQCNDPPTVSGADQATRNRLVDLHFGSRWGSITHPPGSGIPDEHPPESEQEQERLRHYKSDEMFEKRIPGLAAAFLWMCVHFFPMYIKEKLGRPQEVIASTQQYWAQNDTYELFHQSEVEAVMHGREINKNAEVGVEQMYVAFKTWFELCYPKTQIPDLPSFKKQFGTRFGRPTGNKWVGMKLKRDNDAAVGMMQQNAPGRF